MIPAIVATAVVAFLLFYALKSSAQDFDTPSVDIDASGITNGLQKFAQAIARAEGYGIPNAIPTVANNPGDLVIPNWKLGTLGSGISIFDPDTAQQPVQPNGGWFRLYNQLYLISSGASKIYSVNDTIAQMAAKWTETDQDSWAKNVADFLGVDVETSIGTILLQG
jgi:hypothetical protein